MIFKAAVVAFVLFASLLAAVQADPIPIYDCDVQFQSNTEYPAWPLSRITIPMTTRYYLANDIGRVKKVQYEDGKCLNLAYSVSSFPPAYYLSIVLLFHWFWQTNVTIYGMGHRMYCNSTACPCGYGVSPIAPPY